MVRRLGCSSWRRSARCSRMLSSPSLAGTAPPYQRGPTGSLRRRTSRSHRLLRLEPQRERERERGQAREEDDDIYGLHKNAKGDHLGSLKVKVYKVYSTSTQCVHQHALKVTGTSVECPWPSSSMRALLASFEPFYVGRRSRASGIKTKWTSHRVLSPRVLSTQPKSALTCEYRYVLALTRLMYGQIRRSS